MIMTRMVCAILSLPAFFAAFADAGAQERTDTSFSEMDEVVVTYSKWEQDRDELPNRVERISTRDIRLRNPQTAADMLAQSGAVFVQKSQQGGGSPMIRGFATNRVLIVVDGVRMNNAIYRSGNLQNVISVDALSLQGGEVVFGPGSLLYGSDAIGGVMDFHTLRPVYSDSSGTRFSGNALVRHSTANGERTVHADLHFGKGRWAAVSSVSHSEFGDLRMGGRGGPDSYLRRQYVMRTGGVDSVFRNPDPEVQRFSGYGQLNLLQKFALRTGDRSELIYAFTYAGTGTTPRYDRLLLYRNGNPRFAEWDYGPMLWRMHALTHTHNRKTRAYDGSRIVAAYQDYGESRIERQRGSLTRYLQSENVKVLSLNWDAYRRWDSLVLSYGVEVVHNRVGSDGVRTDIISGLVRPDVSRYPDGSLWGTAGAYASLRREFGARWQLTGGLRYAFNRLDARFDTAFIRFPFREARLRRGGLTGNLAVVYRPARHWRITGSLSTGYRMPNVDDVGKLFESVPGFVTVPNPGLRPEYAWNLEAGAEYEVPGILRVECHAFRTRLEDAIVRRPFSFNGRDSMLFAGVMSRVEALQNASLAKVWGLQLSSRWKLSKGLTWIVHANWIRGEETDDARDVQVPLRHAPPFHGTTELRQGFGRFTFELSAMYQSGVPFDRMPPSEALKTDIYARDALGRPYSPAWHVFNLRGEYRAGERTFLVLAWENVTDRRYRPFASGIVAAGSGIVVSLRYGFQKAFPGPRQSG
jgi:hemoglobin/transferrin/lactoferrin receptor protein